MTDLSKITNIKKLYSVCESFNEGDYNIYFCNTQYALYNLMIFSIIKSFSKVVEVPHILCGNMEHPYIIEILNNYVELGMINVTYINADIYGSIQPNEVEKYITSFSDDERICLVVISFVNYMISTINNIKEIGEIAHKNKIPLFCDCIYTFGRQVINPNLNNIDAFTTIINDTNLLIIRLDLVKGYDLCNYSIEFQNNDKLINIDNTTYKDITHILSNLTPQKIETRNKKMILLKKHLLQSLKKSANILYYDNIIKNNTVPKNGDIVIFSTNDTNDINYIPIVSFMYFGDSIKIKNLKKREIVANTDTTIFENIGIKKKYLNKIITIILDNATFNDINKFVKIL